MTLPTASANDSRSLREALGRFATGVTVIGTRNHGGRSIRVATTSCDTVSPPMVLSSVARGAAACTAGSGGAWRMPGRGASTPLGA